MGDHRDDLTWVTVELTRHGEALVEEGLLESVLRKDLRVDEDHPIFIPTTLFQRDGRVIPISLMEGYAFVATGLDEMDYFRLEEQQYVSRIMSTRQGPHKMRYLSVVSNTHIEAMRRKLREMVTTEIPLGTEVSIREGRFRGLEGRVVGMDEANAFVRITLRSLDLVATVPRVFLEKMQEEG